MWNKLFNFVKQSCVKVRKTFYTFKRVFTGRRGKNGKRGYILSRYLENG